MKAGTVERKQQSGSTKPPEDALLAMVGVGKQLWEQESADRLVERLRSGNSELPVPATSVSSNEDLFESVWNRIRRHSGEQFHTVTNLPFTFEVNVAISRCPLRKTTEIKELIDYPYLFALLTDRRISLRAAR